MQAFSRNAGINIHQLHRCSTVRKILQINLSQTCYKIKTRRIKRWRLQAKKCSKQHLAVKRLETKKEWRTRRAWASNLWWLLAKIRSSYWIRLKWLTTLSKAGNRLKKSLETMRPKRLWASSCNLSTMRGLKTTQSRLSSRILAKTWNHKTLERKKLKKNKSGRIWSN